MIKCEKGKEHVKELSLILSVSGLDQSGTRKQLSHGVFGLSAIPRGVRLLSLLRVENK